MTPLAELLRPKNLNDVSGQPHLTGQKGFITKTIEKKNLYRYFFMALLDVEKLRLQDFMPKRLKCGFVL